MFKIKIFIFLSSLPLFGIAQTKQIDKSVFGYKLGEPLPIAECKCTIETMPKSSIYQSKNSLNLKYYRYVGDALINSDCFKRGDLDKYKVNKNGEIPVSHQ